MPDRRTSGARRSARPHRPVRAPERPRPGQTAEVRPAPTQEPAGEVTLVPPVARPVPPTWRPMNRPARPLIRSLGPTGPTIITDYAYVLSDLRRIGILALVAFIILVALSFLIR